jgi:hypothetical protein
MAVRIDDGGVAVVTGGRREELEGWSRTGGSKETGGTRWHGRRATDAGGGQPSRG